MKHYPLSGTSATLNANRQIVITSDQASIVLENVSEAPYEQCWYKCCFYITHQRQHNLLVLVILKTKSIKQVVMFL